MGIYLQALFVSGRASGNRRFGRLDFDDAACELKGSCAALFLTTKGTRMIRAGFKLWKVHRKRLKHNHLEVLRPTDEVFYHEKKGLRS